MNHNIFLIGPMGAGKSCIGRLLANALKKDFYDSDVVLEERAGVTISWIFDVEGEAGMRDREVQVIADLTTRDGIVLATGGGSILRPENRTALGANGTVIYLKASIEQQCKRTATQREHRPLLHVPDPKARIIELHEQREPLYRELADITCCTDSRSAQAVVTEITKKLA